ncbi:MAG: endo-1,4-beta-xylanase [Bacteroidales bacterium]|nr:endo-1,4-beta-xylanase [Bacteroidales bacterium]MCB9013526.1 endo-1,4-beta-xylanase [Bacteroidales bacterium]
MKRLLDRVSILFYFLLATSASLYSQVPDGGTTIIKDPLVNYSRIGVGTLTLVNITGQSFSKAFRFTTGTNVSNSWDTQIGFSPLAGITKDDIILISFFARTTSSLDETGLGSVTVCIEDKTSYDKVIYQRVQIGTEWKQYYVPLKSNATLLSTGMNCAFHMGYVSQTVEIADVQYLNYFGNKTLADMPVTEISYSGREADAPWRAEAEARISQIRKGDIHITVVDSTGAPVSGAEVTISMIRHKFGFGSAIVASTYLTNPTYKAKIKELYNEVVFENDLKWPSYYYKTAAQKNDMMRILDELDSCGIRMRGHNVVWPSWNFNLAYLAGYKTLPEKLRFEIDKHIDDVCNFTKGRVVDWDVINEPFPEHDFMDILGKEVMADWYKRVRNNDPNVKMFLNEYAILSSNGTNYYKQDSVLKIIKYIDDLGGGIQGIGLQSHFGSDLTPITRLKTVLDKFSLPGKEIKITEFDIDVNQPEVQADYTRDFMTMVFSHPAVTAILSWGFWESQHWKPSAAMFNADWSIRPNGEVYEDMVLNQWWTKDTTLTTDESGIVNFNGFLGTYNYKVSFGGSEHSGIIEVLKPVSGGEANDYILSTHPLVPASLSIKVNGETSICEGSTTELAVSIAPDFSIKWFKDDIELPETTSSISVNTGGNYSAQATGKGVTLKTNTVAITVNTFPSAPIDSSDILSFCPGGSVKLSTNVGLPYTYKWYKNGFYALGSVPEITVSETGKYKVEVNSFGCKTVSPELTVTRLSALDAKCATGIFNPETKLKVSPIPFKDVFSIDASGFKSFPVELELLDINGKVVYSDCIESPSHTDFYPELANGFYILRIRSDNITERIKLVREE